MGCVPITPVGAQLQSDTATSAGWVELDSVDTGALTRYYPLTITPTQFVGVAQSTRQHLILRSFGVEETASSAANVKKAPLLVYLYGSQSPTAPVLGSVYEASTVRLLAVVPIATTDYVRVSSTVWRAIVNPDDYIRTEATTDATSIWAVVVSDQSTTLTYAASAAMRLYMVTESGTAL